MKKLLLFVIALTLGLGLRAQTNLTVAVDFTATDIHGTEVHLFDILDGGQAVLIDFFFTTCGPCQQACPKLVQAYTALGCNMHDVFFMEIATGDSDAACLNWVNNFGVEYPTISGVGGGTAICNQYNIPAYPTVILIMPDHSIAIQDLYPISSAQTIINALGNHGIEEHDCNEPGPDAIPDFSTTDIDGKEIHLYDILDNGQAVFINFFLMDDPISINIMNAVTEAYQLFGCNDHDVFFMEITPNGHDEECHTWVETYGVEYPTISPDGGGNTIAQSIPVGFYPTLMLIRPDHTIAVRDVYPPTLYNIINAMEDEGYMQYPCYEETLTLSADTLFFTDDTPFYNNAHCVMLQVTNNTAEPEVIINRFETIPIGEHSETDSYYIIYNNQEYWEGSECNFTIPQGETIDLYVALEEITKYRPFYTQITFKNTLADVSIIASSTIVQSVDESISASTLFPNPANDLVTLKGESLGTVSVYNALGQKVDEFRTESNELNISTTSYESGVYVIKTENGDVMRFVVRH